jgi:predicted PurR-regulated permease PerM
MQETARRAFVWAVVVVAVVAGALALWKLKLVIALVFLGFVIAAAMRPTVDGLGRKGVPRPLGVALHYAGVAALLGLLLWLAVPRAINQIGEAVGTVPTSQRELKQEAKHSTGIKHEILVGAQKRLKKLPSAGSLFHGAVTVGFKAFEVLIGIFFVLATAAYWIFERERAMRLVLAAVPKKHRRTVRDTWNLIDLKLGAYVRGVLLLVLLVATVLSLCFWAIGLPFWLLIGVFAGVVEIVPVIGPLAAGAVAVAVGLTVSWKLALAAGLVVLVVRELEDYIVIPRVMGRAVGLSPLLVLVSVSAVGLLFGGFYVLLSTPFVALVATLVDVILRDKDPAEEEVPAVLFPAAKESEG